MNLNGYYVLFGYSSNNWSSSDQISVVSTVEFKINKKWDRVS